MFINKDIQGQSLGKVWIECMRDVLCYGEKICDEDSTLLEIRNYYVTISKSDEQDAILRAFADQKRIALMKEKYNSCSILPGYKLSYGKLLFNNCGIDQIEWVTNRLRSKAETKSATISMHIPGKDNLSCLSLLDFKLRNGTLDMSVIYRSQNILASQPGNFIALAQLQQRIAMDLQVETGVIEGIILSAHIYGYDIKVAGEILNLYDQRRNM